MKLTNINSTSQNTCNCGSWLNHWKHFSGRPMPERCPDLYCFKQAEVGAHVQKKDSADRNWYILPLCHTHNAQQGGSVEVIDEFPLVSANVSETCGR